MDILDKEINGRTLAILMPGHSVGNFDRRIKEFKDFDWCYAAITCFPQFEKILSKISLSFFLMKNYSPAYQVLFPFFFIFTIGIYRGKMSCPIIILLAS